MRYHPDSGTSHRFRGGCLLRGGVYAYRVFIGTPARRRPPLFSRNQSPVRASRSSALIFLYSASWAAVISSASVPEWVFLHLFTQFPTVCGTRTVGLCHLSDRAGAFQRPPDTTCCLNSSLYFDADIIQTCTSRVRLNLFFITVHETCSTPGAAGSPRSVASFRLLGSGRVEPARPLPPGRRDLRGSSWRGSPPRGRGAAPI